MPEYLFEHTKTGEVHNVFFHMNDTKEYRGPDGKAPASTWKRVWVNPQVAMDAFVVDPYDPKAFVKATAKRGKMGDLWDRSAEWGEKRKAKEGIDPLQQKYFDDYAKSHNGRKHPHQQQTERRANTDKALKKAGIRVEWGDD